MRLSFGVWTLVGAVTGGCIGAGPEPAVVLYSGQALPRAQVAALHGDVESVDDQRVGSQHHSFELLPGCHTVTSSKLWGGIEAQGGLVAHLPEIPFAIDMRAGGTYVVRIVQTGVNGSGGTLSIIAVELGANGETTRQFQSGTRCSSG